MQDFCDLTWAYLERAAADKVVHVEIFFDPQSHTARGVPFLTVLDGICEALEAGKAQLGISSHVIMCFLRHLGAEPAMDTLLQVPGPATHELLTLNKYVTNTLLGTRHPRLAARASAATVQWLGACTVIV